MGNELDVEQLVHESGMPKDLGVEFVDLSPIRVVASMPVDHRHLRPLGFLHGGGSATMAESVATVGAWLNCPPGRWRSGRPSAPPTLSPSAREEGLWRSEYPIALTRKARKGRHNTAGGCGGL